ncbi:uncharacterized protein LOC119672324 [Teleopsis dalmanni]|uniref:uncharacterized protein LOC119672324 n=1 Tax=Teleopsis dalmanni TaxID=139649 RepID=UPI0018CDA56F|nr:uncharacterized protein LOC119672324 [Teleopsis dalmanni]
MLAKLSDPLEHADWVKQLLKIEFAINNSVNRSIGLTPSQALFGINQRGETVDKLTEYLDECISGLEGRDLELIRNSAQKCISRVQKYNLNRSKQVQKSAIEFKEGDFVVIKNVDTTAGTNKKLLPKFKGPYVVQKKLQNDRYVVRDIENAQITQIPYEGIIEACNIKLWKAKGNAIGNAGNTVQ